MDKAIAFKYFVGFKFSNLEVEEQAEVRRGMRLGLLKIDEQRIVRYA
jgi:hypothetical protein